MGDRTRAHLGGRWGSVRDELEPREPSDLSVEELELLSDAWFWLDDPHRSLVARRLAYRRHADAGDDRRASRSAWRLFFEHHLVGESAPASGWLERCRFHAARSGDRSRLAWLAIAEAARSAAEGAPGAALDAARTAVELSSGGSDPDLRAMALQAEGTALIAAGDPESGVRRLDEAMLSVVNDELDPLYTGWVYCNVVSSCYSLADLRRAAEWSEAAQRWCATLDEGSMYPGLCRVYAVELSCLRGDWQHASEQAARACDELTAFDPRYAGAAFALAGDLHRLRGDLDAADQAYGQAHALGVDGQPGRSLLLRDRGRPGEALRSLDNALRPGPSAPLPRAQILAALVEVAVGVGDLALVDDAERRLTTLAIQHPGGLIGALATAAQADRALLDGDHGAAVSGFRRAVDALSEHGFPYEAAKRRCRLADALSLSGDDVSAELELVSAEAVFVELGASEAGSLRLGSRTHTDVPLTGRELEVLRLVADGRTNRQIAEQLVISEHTVARHVSNIRTKLGVASRAAATAVAFENGWIG